MRARNLSPQTVRNYADSAVQLVEQRAPARRPRRPRLKERADLQAYLGDVAASRSAPTVPMRYRALQQLLNASWRRRRSTADQIERRRAKSSAGGRAPPFDKTIYAHRNTAERGFGRLKRGRGIASRYDKCAITYPSPRAGLRYLRIATPGG